MKLASGAGAATPPPNDVCAGAVDIRGTGPFPFLTSPVNIAGATIAGDPPITEEFYRTRVLRSVWFTFTPAVSANYTLATCAAAGATETTADSVMAVYTSAGGCNGPFVQLGEVADCFLQGSISQLFLADTKYYAVIWKYCDGCVEDGLNTVQLLVTATLPPPNDLCAGAIPVQLNIPVAGTTVGAKDDYRIAGTNSFFGIDQSPSDAPGRDVVYSFTAGEAGEYSFKVTGYDVSEDLVLYIAPSCPPGPSGAVSPLRASNRSAVNSAEEVFCLPLAAGQEVFIFVDDAGIANSGSSFILEVTRCVREREPNDSPADAAPLACGIEGSIFPAGDRDFFALGNYPAGWRVFAMVDGEAARNADFDLRITTFSDTIEYDDDNNDQAFGFSSPNIAGAPLPGGPAFAFVSYHTARESEPYRLYAVVQPPLSMAVPETEPNNSILTANSSAENYYLGRLTGPAPSADVDLYSLSVAEGDLIFLSLDADPYRANTPINARLELLDASGAPLVTVNDSAFSSLDGTNISMNTLTGTTPSAPGEALVYRSTVEGTFFARVSISPNAVGSFGAGDYLLSISKNCRVGADGVNHAPVLTNVLINSPATVGVPVTLKGTVWELDTGDPTSLLVDWGDGTTSTAQFTGSGRNDFSLTHTFNAVSPGFNITLIAQDRSGGSDSASVNVRVRPPAQPARFTSIERLGNGFIRLELLGSPNENYRVEQKDSPKSWSTLGTRTADAAGRIVIEDPLPTSVSRFYRAVAE